MKSQSKVFNLLSMAALVFGLAACGSGSDSNTATPPTVAPGTVAPTPTTTCGLPAGYVFTQQFGELPQGACQPGEGQVQGQFGANGAPICVPASPNGNTNCNGTNGVAPGPNGCTAGAVLQNGLCYPVGGGYPGGQYPYYGTGPVGGGGTFGYPYNQNGGYIGGGVYGGVNNCLPGGIPTVRGCVY